MDLATPTHLKSLRDTLSYRLVERRAEVHAAQQARLESGGAGAHEDVRRVTGYQDFVDVAALDLVYLADHARTKQVPVAQRTSFSSVAAGAIAQNVYLFAASVGLATVLRAWIDREAIARALGLSHDHEVLLSQTVGFGKG